MTTGPGYLQMALKEGETERSEEMKKEETERSEELKREGRTEKSQQVGRIDLVVHHHNRHPNHPGRRIPHHYLP